MNDQNPTPEDEDVSGHSIRPLEGDVTVPPGAGDRIGVPLERDDDEDVEGHLGQVRDHIPPPKMDK